MSYSGPQGPFVRPVVPGQVLPGQVVPGQVVPGSRVDSLGRVVDSFGIPQGFVANRISSIGPTGFMPGSQYPGYGGKKDKLRKRNAKKSQSKSKLQKGSSKKSLSKSKSKSQKGCAKKSHQKRDW